MTAGTWRAGVAGVLAAALVVVGLAPPVAAATFSDVSSSHPYRTAISWSADNNMISGYSDGTFRPNDAIRRDQAATMVARYIAYRGRSLPSNPNNYYEDDEGNTHELSINRLTQVGIFSGCGGDWQFCPGSSMRRDQMATVIWKTHQYLTGNGSYTYSNPFSDDNGNVHEQGINIIAFYGVTTGCGAGVYCPSSAMTRGSTSQYLYNLNNWVNTGDGGAGSGGGTTPTTAPPATPTTVTTTQPTTTTTKPTTTPVAPKAKDSGYHLVSIWGEVKALGDAEHFGDPAYEIRDFAIDVVPTPSNKGYWVLSADGGVFTFGDAGFYGSTGNMRLNAPIIGMSPTASGAGYWLLAEDGGIFSFGDAAFYGSTGNMFLNAPIIGMASTVSGKGYWLLGQDGGIFTFGDAQFYGSTGNMTLNFPVIEIQATKDGKGYWLLSLDGGIFTFGDAQFYGSTGNMVLNFPVISMARTKSGNGYWLMAVDGGVFTFGDAQFHGSGDYGNWYIGMAGLR